MGISARGRLKIGVRSSKQQWDKDTRENINIKVILLGSSRLLFRKDSQSHWQDVSKHFISAIGLLLK